MKEETKVCAVRLPASLLGRLDAAVEKRDRSRFVRDAIEARLSLSGDGPVRVSRAASEAVQDGVVGKPHKQPSTGLDARVAAVLAAIEKRGRSSVRQIVKDTGLLEGAVEMVLRKQSDRFRWPEPGVVELAD